MHVWAGDEGQKRRGIEVCRHREPWKAFSATTGPDWICFRNPKIRNMDWWPREEKLEKDLKRMKKQFTKMLQHTILTTTYSNKNELQKEAHTVLTILCAFSSF